MLQLVLVVLPSNTKTTICPELCVCYSTEVKLCTSSAAQLKSSLKSSLDSQYSTSSMRMLGSTPQDARSIFGDQATPAQLEAMYMITEIGFESDPSGLVTDDTIRLRLKAGLSAASHGDPGGITTVPGFLPQRAVLREPTVAENSLSTGLVGSANDSAPLVFFSSYTPPSPPPLDSGVTTDALADGAPSPPGGSGEEILYWLIPVCVFAGLLVLALVGINSYFLLRMYRKPAARVMDVPAPTDGASGKVRVGGGKQRRRSQDDEDEEETEEADEDEDEEEGSPLNSRKPGGAMPSSPRGRRAGGQGASISYEPPVDMSMLNDARCAVGPNGRPTYVLPPVHAPPGRGGRALNSSFGSTASGGRVGGFLDSARVHTHTRAACRQPCRARTHSTHPVTTPLASFHTQVRRPSAPAPSASRYPLRARRPLWAPPRGSPRARPTAAPPPAADSAAAPPPARSPWAAAAAATRRAWSARGTRERPVAATGVARRPCRRGRARAATWPCAGRAASSRAPRERAPRRRAPTA